MTIRTCCLLSVLLLHYCCGVRYGDAASSSLRGQRIQHDDRNSTHDRDAEVTYDPLRLAKSGSSTVQDGDNNHHDVEGRSDFASRSHQIEVAAAAANNPSIQSSSAPDDDASNRAYMQKETYNPLHTTTSTRTLATHPDNKPYRLFRQSTSLYSILSSKKSKRKSCNLVTLEIIWESLQQSRETSWMVTLGSLQDLQDKHSPLYGSYDNTSSGEGTVVEYSHNSYYQPFERHSFCLPGKGLYTFTIFDWGGDGLSSSSGSDKDDSIVSGSYTLYSDDRRVLVSGSKFKYMESQEFTVPLPPMETAKPSVSPSPTVSLEPTQDCEWVDIDILYDMYPEETTWMVILGDYSSLDNGNITIIEQSTLDSGLGEGFTVNVGASGGSTMNKRVCLPGEGRYSFVIFDSYYNGICCEFGDGSYTITTPSLPGEILGQGGEFTTFDIVTFEVPFVRAPSSSPSISPYPTISHSPTVDCKYVQLELKFDGYSSETSWKITKSVDGEEVVVDSSPFYLDTDYGGVYTILTICLPGEGAYTFTIEDKAGDGMCCMYSEGFYTLTYKGDGQEDLIIVTGGEFQYEESTMFMMPYGGPNNLSPTTPAPTVTCYNVEVSITLDSYPHETIWLIVEGGFDSLSLSDDDSISLVAESPKYSFANLNTTEVHVECLPEGTYTFFIFDSDGICCDFGDGEYTVIVSKEDGKEVVIKQGGEFDSVESVTFDLPFVPGSSPTMPPKNQGQPPAQAGETSRYWIDIDIKFDAKPYEISWVVTDNRANMIEESPYYTMFYLDGSESHRVYLPDPGEYSFTIFDKKGDGLCCTLDKNGNFQVTSHDPSGDVVILQGSDFGSEKSITFTVPRNWDGASTWPTPFQDWASSLWPTPIPSPSPFIDTPAPTVIDCTPVKVELLFDVFPYETRWWLVEGDLKAFENKKPKFIGKSPSYDNYDRFSTVEHTFCLADGQYSFMIFDDEGNGMCCKSGDGSYKLTYGENSEVFAKGGRFGFFDSVVFEVPFPSRSPSWTPVPTTMMPTSEAPTIDTPAPTMGGSTPDCDILMDLTTDTAGDQNAIRWEVVLGDQSSVTNSFALIVAQSEQEMFSTSSLDKRTIDSDKVCLPSGDGQYTFTIFDNNSGEDTRYRLIVDGIQVAYGSDFGYQESTTFNVPGTGQPTPAPQPVDSVNNPSPTECTLIDISITFDEFPDETYWVLYEGGGDELDEEAVIANSPYYLNMTNSNSTSHRACLPGDGEYTFVMYDVANDGMCCSFGKGGYVVSSVEEPVIIVAQGAEFEGADITTFSVPIMIAPSTAPTVTPRPTESASPTIPCSDIELTVTFDAYPSETSWTLFDADNNTVASSPFYQNIDFANDTIQEIFCLPDGSYLFLITDQAGDGNCCAGLGDGSYSIMYQDGAFSQIIVDKGPDPTFVYYDSTEFTIPYVLQPTKSPTLSPAPTTSMAPTARCVKMEVIINFDAFPSDTLWEITVGDSNSWDNNNAVIAADSPIYTAIDTFSTVTHSICLPGAETYTFTVFDGTGNGMCCDEGTGGFVILMIDDDGNREIIAEGGEFEWRLSTQFDLPIYIGPRMSNL